VKPLLRGGSSFTQQALYSKAVDTKILNDRDHFNIAYHLKLALENTD
jgi:hypothetical protein